MPKLGDPPAFPTPIDKCPKCGKREGWKWKNSTSMEEGDGFSTCEACGAEFH